MMLPRTSPLHETLQSLHPVWGEFNGMPTAIGFAAEPASTTQIADVSCLGRVGLKGPSAIEWLESRGLSVPRQPNTWHALTGGALMLRLGRTEILIEEGIDRYIAQPLENEMQTMSVPGVYPVLRQDASLVVRGNQVHRLFEQICSIDLTCLEGNDRVVAMTMLAGISATVICTSIGGTTCYRLWCDPTYAVYLWDTLFTLATELGGGAVGLAEIYPDFVFQSAKQVDRQA